MWSSGVAYLCLIPKLTWPPLPTLDSFSSLLTTSVSDSKILES